MIYCMLLLLVASIFCGYEPEITTLVDTATTMNYRFHTDGSITVRVTTTTTTTTITTTIGKESGFSSSFNAAALVPCGVSSKDYINPSGVLHMLRHDNDCK